MKRYIKLALGALLTVMLCLSFCSCNFIDEMRLHHAKWTDETKTVISFRGKEYKKLPHCEDLNFIDSGEIEMSYVTENDVPLLLSGLSGDCVSVSKDEEFLSVETWEIFNDSYIYDTYCRSDLYDEISKAIETYKLDRFCVLKTNEYYDKNGNYHFETSHKLLSDKATESINKALGEEGEKKQSLNTKYGIDVFYCDQSLRFISSAEMDWVYLWVENDGSIAVVTYDAESLVSDEVSYIVRYINGNGAEAIQQELFSKF